MGERWKVGHYTATGFFTLAEGSEAYCTGWCDGYNQYADIDAVVLPKEGCSCGPLRDPYVQNTPGFKPRAGCLRCGNWDGPPEVEDR